jgi:spore germination protein YaaH
MLGIFQRKPSPIKVFAWIAGTTETNRRAYINLRSASLRNNLVTLATAIVQLGYDGVHFNIEPIPDRTYCPTTADCLNGINRTHTAFVQLLVQLKQAIGQSRISVTTGTYHSYGGSTLLTQNSYKQIIPHTGQLVVLNYDISILAPNATRNQQAIATAANNIIQAAGTQGTKVIFGLPNHNTRRPHHGPHETLANAYLGLSTVLPAVQQMGGFAMYTEQIWTAPDGNPKRMNNFRNRPDWTTWQKLRTLGCP